MTVAHQHYSRPEVQKEISEFCRDRWVAAHYIDPSSRLVFRRYVHGKPMTIRSPEILETLLELEGYYLRSIYATSNVYETLGDVEDVYDLSNIRFCTPVWDIDGELSRWRETISIAREIVSFLEERGVEKSTYVKWSGNGCHVHIHERAFSGNLLKRLHPLDVAYAVVEYVNSKLFPKLATLRLRGKTVVENKIDPTRVFTCPLSLHRRLDVVCVCIKPDRLDDFSPEWIQPLTFRHDPSWRESLEGEADGLAEDAYRTVGGYPFQPRRRRRRRIPLDEQIRRWLQRCGQ